MNKSGEIRGSLLARNTLLNLIGQAVPLVVGVVTIPFIVWGLARSALGCCHRDGDMGMTITCQYPIGHRQGGINARFKT